MRTEQIWEQPQPQYKLKEMKGLAAAVIRQAFEDSKCHVKQPVEVVKLWMKPKENSLVRLGKIEKGKLLGLKYTDNDVKVLKRENFNNGYIKENKLYVKSLDLTYTIEKVKDCTQKLLLLKKKPVGYISKNVCNLCEFEYDKNGNIIYTKEIKLKTRSSGTATLSRAEVFEARDFVLARNRYWRTALEFWCDVAELDWTFIVRMAKRQDWYSAYVNERKV